METNLQQAATPREALSLAADYIERFGHTKGAYGTDGHPRCIVGAIGAVSLHGPKHSFSDAHRVYARAFMALEARPAIAPFSLPHKNAVVAWNDHPDRTKEEVIAELRATAESIPMP